MLNQDGKEILEIGIDDDVSLHEGLLNKSGLDFLNKFYDKLIADSEYDVSRERELIEKFFY